jgi:hypothetical protein
MRSSMPLSMPGPLASSSLPMNRLKRVGDYDGINHPWSVRSSLASTDGLRFTARLRRALASEIKRRFRCGRLSVQRSRMPNRSLRVLVNVDPAPHV